MVVYQTTDDIFREILHNRNINNRLEAWLVFLSMEEPEMIRRLIEAFPDFMPIYEQIYDLCQNVEEVMRMFSKELREMDRNTVQLMIDELQERLERQEEEIEEKKRHETELMKKCQQYERLLQEAKESIALLKQTAEISKK